MLLTRPNNYYTAKFSVNILCDCLSESTRCKPITLQKYKKNNNPQILQVVEYENRMTFGYLPKIYRRFARDNQMLLFRLPSLLITSTRKTINFKYHIRAKFLKTSTHIIFTLSFKIQVTLCLSASTFSC